MDDSIMRFANRTEFRGLAGGKLSDSQRHMAAVWQSGRSRNAEGRRGSWRSTLLCLNKNLKPM